MGVLLELAVTVSRAVRVLFHSACDTCVGMLGVLGERLRAIGIPCFEPEGAFYVFPNIGGFGMTSEEFCEKLLYDYRVAIVPGTAFGACGEGFARISYAYSVEHIDEALDRMEKMIQDLKSKK